MTYLTPEFIYSLSSMASELQTCIKLIQVIKTHHI